MIGLVLAVGLILPATAVAVTSNYTVVASGLHSPRGLSFGPGNILYAAEAGDATHSGSILQITNSMSRHPIVRTILGGIAKIGDEGQFIGIDGISVRGRGTNQSIFGIVGLSPQATGGNANFGALIKVDRTGHSTSPTSDRSCTIGLPPTAACGRSSPTRTRTASWPCPATCT